MIALPQSGTRLEYATGQKCAAPDILVNPRHVVAIFSDEAYFRSSVLSLLTVTGVIYWGHYPTPDAADAAKQSIVAAVQAAQGA